MYFLELILTYLKNKRILFRWRNGTVYGSESQFFYSHGDRYLGEWVQGVQEGIGTLYTQTGAYVGQWQGGLQVRGV